jgi:hypothetical protein
MEKKLKHLIISTTTVSRYHKLLARFWRVVQMIAGPLVNDHLNLHPTFERVLKWVDQGWKEARKGSQTPNITVINSKRLFLLATEPQN